MVKIMKIMIEATPESAAITFKLNGDTFKQNWELVAPGHAKSIGKSFAEQAESTGKYDEECAELIYEAVDSNIVVLQLMQLSEECE